MGSTVAAPQTVQSKPGFELVATCCMPSPLPPHIDMPPPLPPHTVIPPPLPPHTVIPPPLPPHTVIPPPLPPHTVMPAQAVLACLASCCFSTRVQCD
ncbi:hypothetical protein RRG08_024427 [Elysia crispata]|uniref:Uncharacterized protein n=1 Tax=Elysia crispata TaxID=231223 RepID=A0AAE1D2R8_9GAST|nr:hypothetical protein RRG08_024427 [Elysia crispata]